jgi:hypothetical protein
MPLEDASSLLEALFIYGKTTILDRAAKRALRLCNKHFKNLVDATVTGAILSSYHLPYNLKTLMNTEWHGLKNLYVWHSAGLRCENPLKKLPSALFIKFSRLETLEIYRCFSLEALPEEIGELSHLKRLVLSECVSLQALPSSLGKLTALETIILASFGELTSEGLGPLQLLTGLTSLEMANNSPDVKIKKYPDLICNLTSLKELRLYSESINTLPDALGNLTNLESLIIHLEKLKELPESIGDLNALKVIDFVHCPRLATLPESLDDLLWRKAHETEGSGMEYINLGGCGSKLVMSSKMKLALHILKLEVVIVS